MNAQPQPPFLSRETILRFLEYTPPFSEVDRDTLEEIADTCRVEFYPGRTMILERGKSQVDHLRLIYEGRVKLFLRDQDGEISLQDYRGEGEAIGALAILRNSLSNLGVVTETDTICILISRDEFLSLIQNNSRFSQYYLKAITEGYVSKALSTLENPRQRVGSEGTLYLFSAQVGDVIRRRPASISGEDSVRQAAELMNEIKVGSLLVTNPHGEFVGLLTDRDLRTKVVARALDYATPVKEIMSSPLQTVPAHTLCFDALLEMMKRRVHHLVLERRGEIVGVLSGHDLMITTGSSPLALVREITAVQKIEELYDISLKSPRVVASLIYEGAKASNVTRMITLINDYILDRLLDLLQEELGPPPVPFCWLLMGSEGRREQTFRTDQDNGLLYADPADPAQALECQNYFRYFGTMAIEHLVACGFPRCQGGIMASNPQWCQPYSVWAGYFDRWITTPEPKEVLNATIFFDFRGGYGELELARDLRKHLTQMLKGKDVFLRYLAKDTLTTPSALTFFRNLAVEREGEFKDRFDIKHKGLVPFIDYARVMALKHGVAETNTLGRYQLLDQNQAISHAMFQTATQAFEFQMQLRLLHQQMLHEEGFQPDNYLDPEELSEMERRTLKETLQVIGDIKAHLKNEFRLDAA
ncbi:histidine kinase [Desulfocarbo indianensis]|nr:histidine kinase [Desulfocarbo indianensis]